MHSTPAQNNMPSSETTGAQKRLDYPVEIYYLTLSQMYNQHIAWHWHEEMEFDIIAEGQACMTVGDDAIPLKAGQGILIHQNALHTLRPVGEAPCTCYCIIFHPSYLFGYGRTLMSAQYLVPIQASPMKYLLLSPENADEKEVLEHLRSIIHFRFSKKYGQELLIKSVLCFVWYKLLELLQIETTPPKSEVVSVTLDEMRVKQIITYIQKNYMHAISLNDISSYVHISKSECCRCFKRTLSLTPFEYLMRYRIYEAARKIYSHDPVADSIAMLAASVGFNNTSYFNKLFKKYMKSTPNGYKKMLLQNPDLLLDAFGQPEVAPLLKDPLSGKIEQRSPV